jgi:hypothetical protein
LVDLAPVNLIFAAATDDGVALDQPACERLFGVAARVVQQPVDVPEVWCAEADRIAANAQVAILADVTERNSLYFDQESEKIDHWAEDLKWNLENELKALDLEIRSLKKQARISGDLQGKLDSQRRMNELERQRNRKRRELFDAQDEIDRRKDGLLEEVSARLRQQITNKELFTIRWRVI